MKEVAKMAKKKKISKGLYYTLSVSFVFFIITWVARGVEIVYILLNKLFGIFIGRINPNLYSKINTLYFEQLDIWTIISMVVVCILLFYILVGALDHE